MYTTNVKLAIIPTVAMIFCGCIALIMERKLGAVYEEISEENAELNTVAEENLAGVRTVKAFAREKYEIEKFLNHNNRYYELNMKQSKVFVKYYPYFSVVTKILPLLTLLAGGKIVIDGRMSLGQLAAMVEYSNNIVWPMEMLGWLTNSFSSAIASNRKLKKIYNEVPTIKEKENPIILDEVKGKITFDHVAYGKEGKHILRDVSFEVQPGETLGIMGETGSGKSTIINLMSRFYDADKGTIKLGGRDISTINPENLLSAYSIVFQDVTLFNNTIMENIRIGRKGATDEEVINAAKEAQCDEFIRKLPQGYQMVIGENGCALSGGERQRISIARALLKDSPIILLDEATASLDADNETLIQQAISRLIKDKTVIIIAHRMRTVSGADKIVVLEDGIVKEQGRPEDLIKNNGTYAKMVKLQAVD